MIREQHYRSESDILAVIMTSFWRPGLLNNMYTSSENLSNIVLVSIFTHFFRHMLVQIYSIKCQHSANILRLTCVLRDYETGRD